MKGCQGFRRTTADAEGYSVLSIGARLASQANSPANRAAARLGKITAIRNKLTTCLRRLWANSGSASIVQFYIRNLGASLEQPVQSLQGFKRVTLQPGESKQVSFDLGFPELSFYNNAGQAVIEPTRYTVWIGGSSEASEHADFDIVP
jgi:hypothetical protein